jgi:Xaa-Pro aminopeptidase
MLTPELLPRVQRALADLELDGWLLYDFRGCNPIAQSMLGLEGLQTRRIFGWIPRDGVPVAIVHRIEPGPLRRWPNEWPKRQYSGWRELEKQIGQLVQKKRRIAMETSMFDAVPVLDRVPAGVIQLVENATYRDAVTSSGELVSMFYATLTSDQIASHARAAEAIAEIAHAAMQHAGERARSGEPATEYEIFQWIHDAFARARLTTDHGPSVSANANAADPHYEPTAEQSERITSGSTLLIDLFAHEQGGVWADQCWMGTMGPPNERVAKLWVDVRDARDAAIDFIKAQTRAGVPLKGAAVDDIARGVLRQRGVADQFTHRTGHSIDARELHGAGPNLDNLETREERLLLPGVAFSIEPGVYFLGEVGLRSEVNAIIAGGPGGELLVTPNEYQRELIVV